MNRLLVKNVALIGLMTAWLIGCKGPDTPPIVSHEMPKGTISIARAQQMYKAYQDRFNALTAYRNGNEDARYGWHSLDFYKNYIAFLEYESAKAHIKISGLRLYYVAYPNDDASHEYKDYQTYIYVPTYYDEKTKQHIAFDPLYLDAEGKPIPIHKLITGEASGKEVGMASFMMLTTGSTTTTGSIGNMGEMCKPNCSE